MSAQTKERPKAKRQNPTQIIHVTDPPYTSALCGTSITRVGEYDPAAVECVVCAEIDGNG